MNSWRDIASRQAQNDFDRLTNATLPFARQQLRKRGEFFPFAAASRLDGEEVLISAAPGDGEQPASADVLVMTVRGLRAQRDTFRARRAAARRCVVSRS